MIKTSSVFKEQVVPIALTIITFFSLCILLYIFILALNLFPSTQHIKPQLRLADILIGLTIYLKTSIDFAIFIGNVMSSNPGWKKRVAIELGTALGNASGTLLILFLWNFFRNIPLLMIVMILISSFVLIKMAEESIDEFMKSITKKHSLHTPLKLLNIQLKFINRLTKPFLKYIIPESTITNVKTLSFVSLFIFAFTIPFILGLDDFAGYIPLFSIINVFGFAIGVFLGHMTLNVGLFIAPQKTIKLVKTRAALLFGGLAFIGIALWGIFEVFELAISLF